MPSFLDRRAVLPPFFRFHGARSRTLPPGSRVLPVLLLPILVVLATFLPAPGAAAQTATVQVKGSDTIGGALGPGLARAYVATRPGVEVDWEGLGSGTAFVGLFDGSAALGASSRPIRESEVEEARRLGLTLREYVLGYDGIAVLVHPSNPVDRLTLDELAGLFSGRLDNWRQVGGPDRPVRRISRPSYSGTHGFFKDTVLGDDIGFAPDTEWVEHSEEIVRLVGSDPGAVSYLGMGWIGPGVKAVAVAPEAGEEAVLPSGTTVRAGSYPIYRPLLLYTRGEPRGELRSLLAFVLGPAGQRLVERHDFIPSDAPCPVCDEPGTATVRRGDGDIELYRVFFAFGGTRLDGEARRVLARVADRLKAGGRRALVTGHADADGTPEQNAAVALARARTVARALVDLGVPVDLLTVEGRSADEPIATNESAGGRNRNRRADVRLLPQR